MIVQIGFGKKILGTLENAHDAITMKGNNDKLSPVVAMKEPAQSAEAFLSSLPKRLNSYMWATVLEKQETKYNHEHNEANGRFGPGGDFHAPDEMQQAYHSDVAALSSIQKEEIGNYTNISSGYLNNALRKGIALDPEDQKSINDIQDALMSTTTPFPLTVVRGMKQHNVPGMPKYLEPLFQQFKENIGKDFVDPAFGSTTVDKNPPGTVTGSDPDMVLHISVPKGAHGLYIQDASSVPDEHEFLVPHSTKYTVKSATKKDNGKYFVELQMHIQETKGSEPSALKKDPYHDEGGRFATGGSGDFHSADEMRTAYAEKVAALPSAQKEEIEKYTNTSSMYINNTLRTSADDLDSEDRESVDTLQKALNSTTAPFSFTVLRGLKQQKGSRAPKFLEPMFQELKKNVGKTFTDPAFGSSTVDKTSPKEGTFSNPDMVLHISVPKGAHGLYLQDVSSVPGEHEFLIPHSTKYTVKSATKKPDGKYFVELEMQLQKTKSIEVEEQKHNLNHSSTTGQFIGDDDGAGGVHADVLTTMPAHIAKALSDKGVMTRGADGVYTASLNGKTYRIVPTGSTRIAFSQTGASRIADLVGASDTVPTVHSATVDKEPVVVTEDVKATPLDDKTATEAMEKMPPDQVTKVGMLEYILGMKQDQSGHYTLNQKTGKINLTQLSSALVKKDIAIQSHSFLMKVIGKSFLRNSIDHGILGKFLSKETKALILSKEYAANTEAALGFSKRFEVLHQLAGMKNPTWEDFFKITAHPESQTGGMPPKHPAEPTVVKPLNKPHTPAAHSAPAHGAKPHNPVPRKKPGHRSAGKMLPQLDLSLYLPEKKYHVEPFFFEQKDGTIDALNTAIGSSSQLLSEEMQTIIDRFLQTPASQNMTQADRQALLERAMVASTLADLSPEDQALLLGKQQEPESKYNHEHSGADGKFAPTQVHAKYSDPEDLPSMKSFMESDVPLRNFSQSDDRTSQAGDQVLAAIYKDQGFDGKPHIISDDELTSYIAGGERELYRGVGSVEDEEGAGEKYANDYQSGSYFAGLGNFGNGTYTAITTPGQKITAEAQAGKFGDHILHLSVMPSAKVIDSEALRVEQYAYRDQLEKKIDAAYNTNDDASAKKYNRLLEVVKDRGRFAALRGYDAVHIQRNVDPGKPKGNVDYFNVLNRTATRVQKTVIVVPSYPYA